MQALIICGLVLLLSAGCLAQDRKVSITSSGASLRGAPTTRAKITTPLPKGETYELIVIRSEWYLIQTPDNVGWIHSSEGRLSGSTSGAGQGGGSENGRFTGWSNETPADISQGSGRGVGTGQNTTEREPPLIGLKILSKPQASFTDLACQEGFSGTVILRVMFLGSGQIGSIATVKGAPYGLTEQAILAAKQIKFEPAKTREGKPVAVTKQLEYTFDRC